MNLETFLSESGYTHEDWEKSGLEWAQLEGIAKHHNTSLKTLALHGGSIANRLQEFTGVHSVRWRVKDTFGLLKKILRKNLEAEPKDKWKNISSKNYTTVVSDLIGVRALHLLKEDCFIIDEQIRETWETNQISIFKRSGDRELTEIIERGAKEEIHNAGYRSIHYDLVYSPEKKPIYVEVQVRTIFQEGWSEIDHKVKYPDFSENTVLIHYLDLFNGLSGTADDMGSFVIQLDQLIKQTDSAILKGEADLIARDADIEALQQEVNKLKAEGKISETSIDSLQSSVNKIKYKSSYDTETKSQRRTGKSLSELLGPAHPTADMNSKRNIGTVFDSNNSIRRLIDQINTPSNNLSKALEQLSSPNSKLAKALLQLNSPNTRLSNAIDELTTPNSNLSKALEQIRSPNSRLAKALESLGNPSADLSNHAGLISDSNTDLDKKDE